MKALICFSESAYQKAKTTEQCLFLLVFSKVDSIEDNSQHVYIPIEPIDSAECVQAYTECVVKSGSDVLNSFLNNGYYYGAATIAGVCSNIKGVLLASFITSVELHGDSCDEYLPTYFTAWGESSKNILTSGDCFYKYVAQSLADSFGLRLIKNAGVGQSVKSKFKKILRFLLVPLVCFIYSLRKLRFNINRYSKNDVLDKNKSKSYFIIRTQHQLNVAQNIITSLELKQENVVMVELESLSSLDLIDQLQKSGYRVISPYSGLSGMVLSVVSLLKAYYWIARIQSNTLKGKFEFEGVKYRLKSIMVDAAIQPQVFIYQALIYRFSRFIESTERPRVFSFEQVSPQAYFDNQFLDDVSDLFFVKSTLIQAINIPCICWGNRFLVNNINELSLGEYSYLNGSSVIYNGSPKYSAILGLKQSLSKSINQVLFATQPHEPYVNRLIIDSLVKAGVQQGFVTVVRKHPRDKQDYHCGNSRQLIFDRSVDLYHQLAAADLVIARTSTILEECIYIGVPYLSCIFSEKDRAYSADYLEPTSGLVVNSSEQLTNELEAYDIIISRFKLWRNKYLIKFKRFSLEKINNYMV
jgi:hypothetical protein